ncbi:acylphosphatase [Mannheimia sp. AT1]|uniref:acylphosphatase n=1 Tax=Mannheimia cairinae TaxID=3025936 RepID=A0ABT5MSF1_9PAST|nr:acylphosphatase [Mannheimia cairinae]MDD0823778.1 acylphosphatase [Mannheimia cairinae]
METRLFSVYGRVQGVAFRFFTLQEARKLGIKGYARNRDDNSVEVVATADSETLAQFEKWLHKGSPAAKVEQVIVSDYLGSEVFRQFEIRH